MAPVDIDGAFLKRLTYCELAEAAGEKERMVCFTFPPGSASALRALPGFSSCDGLSILCSASSQA
eukprot:4100810-Pyramimonas_sp.AAC.1